MIQTQSKRQQIVVAVAAHLLKEGLRNNSLKAMGDSVGISDRMVVYYFDKKDALVREALLLIAENLTEWLDKALPDRNVSGAQLVRTLTDLSKSGGTKPLQELWFEMVGLAIRGEEPYKTVAGLFVEKYEDWIRGKLPTRDKHRAGPILAEIEGTLMINLLRLAKRDQGADKLRG